jgi:hypothetical protein
MHLPDAMTASPVLAIRRRDGRVVVAWSDRAS